MPATNNAARTISRATPSTRLAIVARLMRPAERASFTLIRSAAYHTVFPSLTGRPLLQRADSLRFENGIGSTKKAPASPRGQRRMDERLVRAFQQIRRTPPAKSLPLLTAELPADRLVDRASVGTAPGQLAHHDFHHFPQLLCRRGAGFLDGLVDRFLDLGRVDRRRQVRLERGDFRGFARRQLRASSLDELLGGIPPLLDQRRDHLLRLRVV